MKNDRIEINVSDATGELIGKLDVIEAEINSVYQINDIAEPDSLKSSYIRAFTLPGSKRNNKVFAGIFEQGYSVGRYNPNFKLSAQVLLEGNIFFQGSLQLLKINKKGNDVISYEVAIYGSTTNFFDDLGDASLQSVVDLSEYNHPFGADSIIGSWGSSNYLRSKKTGSSLNSTNGFVWKKNKKVASMLGQGYVYPFFYNGQTETTLIADTTTFQPAVYAYEILKKTFDKFGWKWKSRFLESQYFKSLIIPFSKDSIELGQTQVDSAGFKVNLGTVAAPGVELARIWSTVAQTTAPVKIAFSTVESNPGLAWDAGSKEFVCSRSGQYSIGSYLYLSNVYEGQPFIEGIIKGNPITGKAMLMRGGTPIASTDFTFGPVDGKKFATPLTLTTQALVEYRGNLSEGDRLSVWVTFTMPPGQYASKTLYAGAPVQTRIFFYATANSNTESSRFYGSLASKTLVAGDTIYMNSMVPDMQAAAFVKSINKLFNLYWIRDQSSEKTFIIEPREAFFSSEDAKIIDWTKRIDEGEVLSIQPLYNLTARKFSFSYSEDNDYYNKKYSDDYDEAYGSKQVEVENDFITEESQFTSIWAASPLVEFLSTGIKAVPFVSETNGKMVRMTPKPRLLFWGGMKAAKSAFRIVEPSTAGSTTYTPTPQTSIPSGGLTQWVYPYAGHLDDPDLPSHDLSFGTPKTFYFPAGRITGNTVYSEFWEKTIKELTDKDNHLITCQVILMPSDIAQLDLRNIIQANNVYYRINKLTYNPEIYQAEVELYKVYDYVPYSAVSVPGSGANPTWALGINTNPDGWKWKTWPFDLKWYRGPWTWDAEMIDWNTATLYEGPAPAWKARDYYSELHSLESWSDIRPAGDFYPLQTWNSTWTKTTNSYSPQSGIAIQGKWNSIDPSARAAHIYGDWNSVANDARNISINGNYNTVLSGLENVVIFGSNITARESNVTYINGAVFRGTGIQTAVAKSPANETIAENSGVIHGGKNSVLSFNKQAQRGIIIGGIDNANWFGYIEQSKDF